MTKPDVRPRERLVEARRFDPTAATRPRLDEFTYTVLIDPPPSRVPSDRRGNRRQGTRLRSGKIVDAEGRFITECLVRDLSAAGLRLRLPAGVALPRSIQFYDDQTGLLHQGAVRWRREGDAGVLLKPSPTTPLSRKMAEDMRRKYYRAKT